MADHEHPDSHRAELPEHGEWTEAMAQRYADRYGDWPSNRYVAERVGLQPGETLLDIGCGTGSALRHAAGLVPDARFIGVDPTPGMVRIAAGQATQSEVAARVTFFEGAAESIPLPGAAADVAMALNSMHHWGDRAAGFAEALRVLTPGGRLVIAEEDVMEEGGYPDAGPIEAHMREAGFERASSTRHDLRGPEGPIRLTLTVGHKSRLG